MEKNPWIGPVAIVAALGIIGAYYVGANPSGATQQASSPQAIAPSAGTPDTASLAEQKQCATDGAAFYRNWVMANVPAGSTTYDPEYHFSQKLNTCLAYVGDASQATNNPWYGTLNGQTVVAYTTTASSHYNFVYEIYSNKLILQSETYRQCTAALAPEADMGSFTPNPPAGPCTDDLSSFVIYTDLPNLGINDFLAQEQTLMSQ